MGRVLLISALFAFGCASSDQALHESQEAQYKADKAASRGDYHKAAKEQERANRYKQEAYDRARYGL
jgi:hypothetical protein